MQINDFTMEANVIDVTKIENNGKVLFGSTVNVQDLENKKIKYKIVGQDEAEISKFNFLSKSNSKSLDWEKRRRYGFR